MLRVCVRTHSEKKSIQLLLLLYIKIIIIYFIRLYSR